MNEYFITGLLLGMMASLMMNVGKGVQKQYVRIFSAGREILKKEHRRDLVLWTIGFLITASSTIPYSLGLKLSKSPSAISAMTGVGLIGLGYYSVKVIGERFGKPDFIGISLVVIGTSLLGYVGAGNHPIARHFSDLHLLIAIVMLIAVASVGCLASRFVPSIQGAAFGGAAGMCIGLAIFLADIALVEAGGSFSGQLKNPYPYFALLFAATATVVTQVGFLRSRALEVVSAVNSTAILTPLLLEVLIYETHPQAIHLFLVLVIVTGVLFLSRGAASQAAG